MSSPSYTEAGIATGKTEGILRCTICKFIEGRQLSPGVSDPPVHKRLEDPDILSQVPEDPPHVTDGGLTSLTRWRGVAIEQDFPFQTKFTIQIHF